MLSALTRTASALARRSSCRSVAASSTSSSSRHPVSSSSIQSLHGDAASSCSRSGFPSIGQLRSMLTVSTGPSRSATSSLTPAANRTLLQPNGIFSLAPTFLNLGVTIMTPPSPIVTQTRSFAARRFHRKKIVKAAKGYRGQANRNFRAAIKRVERARQNAYRDRRLRRREFRKLWIQRLNAGVRQHGIRYSRFINMLNNSEVQLDRKILSELAMHEPFSFKAVVDVVKARAGDPRQKAISG